MTWERCAYLTVSRPHLGAREVGKVDCQVVTLPAKTQAVLSPRGRQGGWRPGGIGRICHRTIVFCHLSHLLSILLRCHFDCMKLSPTSPGRPTCSICVPTLLCFHPDNSISQTCPYQNSPVYCLPLSVHCEHFESRELALFMFMSLIPLRVPGYCRSSGGF